MLQIIDHKCFEGSSQKKGIKSRLSVSDGISIGAVIISEKVADRFEDAIWSKSLVPFQVISISSEFLTTQNASGKPIMILRRPFKIEFTGLKRVLGSPKDYTATMNDPAVLNQRVDLRIPEAETDQGRGRLKSDALEDLGDLDASILGTNEDTTDVLRKNLQGLDISKSKNVGQKRVSQFSKGPEAPSLDEEYVPVNCLNTYVQDWAIKVKVTKKYEMRTWNNARGSGTLLNIDMMDRSRHQIQATFFKDAAQKYNEEIHEGRTYVMRGGQVKLANKRYTTIPNDHCITFDIGATIEECGDDVAMKQLNGNIYNFTSFAKLKAAAVSDDPKAQVPQMIDFIGVVLEVQDLGQIQLKSTGEMRDRRSLTLGDESGNSVMATLWGEAATDRTFAPGLVIACKGAKVSDYGGKSLNVSK